MISVPETVHTTAQREPVIQQVDEGKTVRALGNTITIKLTGVETNDQYSVVIYTAPPGYAGPPLHRHTFDEYFFVLEGELTISTSDAQVALQPGGSVYVPGGSAHTFSNPSSKPVTFQIVINPPGFEHFFEEVAEAMSAGDPPDMAILAELNHKYGVETITQ